MKVMLVSPLPPPVGGIATMTANLVSYYKNNKNGISLILFNTSHKYRNITSQSLILRLLTGFLHSALIYYKVRKMIKKQKPQVIHLSSSSSFALLKDWLIINFAINKKIPIVMHWHFGRIPHLSVQGNWEWKLLCHVINKSSWSIVIDAISYNILYDLGFRNVSNIPNPLALEIEQMSKKLSRNTDQLTQGRIIFVGHIIKSKGVYELVEACSQLHVIKELLLVGPYEKNTVNELSVLAEKRDNGNWLKLTGTISRNNVLKLMQNSSILALPSYTEGFPNVVLEAMSMGCTVIATDVGAIPEMLAVETKTPCGICVPVRNIEKLKKAILELTNDPNLAVTLGNNGKKRILNNYTLEKVVKQYRGIWESLAIS